MASNALRAKLTLPKGWHKNVRAAIVHVVSLAQHAMAYTRGWAADSLNARVRLKAQLDQATQEIALLREEIRIKNARLARIPAHRRPHDPPTQRLAIFGIMGVTVFRPEPTSEAVRTFLGRVMHSVKAKPRHLVTDKRSQFWNDRFKAWCKRRNIKPRFGAVGRHGSIALIERLI